MGLQIYEVCARLLGLGEEQGRSRLDHEGVKPAVTCSIACWLTNQLSVMSARRSQEGERKGLQLKEMSLAGTSEKVVKSEQASGMTAEK